MQRPLRCLWTILLVMTGVSPVLADPSSFLQTQEDIPLLGGASRFDYQFLDTENNLLYFSHMGAGQIVVFNTQQGKVLQTLSGFPGVTGLLVLPQFHRLYASVTKSPCIAVVDTQTQKIVGRIPAGHFPDAIAYVPGTHQLYVSDEMGAEVIVIDVLKNKRVASIKLNGEAGNTRYNPSDHLVYTCVQSKNELVAIDPNSLKIVNRYPIRGGKHPHGLLIDPNSNLAFIACDGNEKLTVMDLKNFQEIGASDVGKDPDVMSFDSNLGYLYVASESGTVSVFRVRDRKMEKIGDYPVGNNAHSVEVDSRTHFVYFPLSKSGKGPVLRIMKPAN